jgi:hypothetical protein
METAFGIRVSPRSRALACSKRSKTCGPSDNEREHGTFVALDRLEEAPWRAERWKPTSVSLAPASPG